MKIILFLTDNEKFSFDKTGAAALKTSHLVALNQISEYHIHVIILGNSPNTEVNYLENILPIIETERISLTALSLNYNKPKTKYYQILTNYFFSYGSIRKQGTIFSTINHFNISQLNSTINRINPDIIWTEHLEPSLLMSHINFEGIKVYSHHDFLSKLILIRRKKLKDYINSYIVKKIQTSFIKKFGTHVTAASENEIAEIKRIAPNSKLYYQPTIYPPITVKWSEVKPQILRIIHLGTLRATANKVGLLNLLKYVLPKLKGNIQFECWIIGDLTNADKETVTLLNDECVNCIGYVEDLTTVLRPADIHLLPYNYATGTRTRLPLIFNHGQLVIAHKEAVNGMRDIENNVNCVVVNDFSEMANKIIELGKDFKLRTSIAKRAKQKHDILFNFGNYSEKLKAFLS